MPASTMVKAVFEMDQAITKRDSLVLNAYLTEQRRNHDIQSEAHMSAEFQELKQSVAELKELVTQIASGVQMSRW